MVEEPSHSRCVVVAEPVLLQEFAVSTRVKELVDGCDETR